MGIVILVLAVAAVVFFAVFTAFGYFSIFHLRFHSLEYTLERCYERGDFKPSLLELPWEAISVYSPRRKAELAGLCLAADPAPQAAPVAQPAMTVIIIHGRSWTRYGAMKYAGGFIERSCNIVVYDLAGHGRSPAGALPVPSYGYDDKYDLDAVVDWTRARFPETKKLVLLGESLGAATALQYAPMAAPMAAAAAAAAGEVARRKVDAIIADCPFSSMTDSVFYRLKAMHAPFFISKPVVFFISAISRRRRGYSLDDISPYNAALLSPIPVLFIHGEADFYIPAWMSCAMAEARREKGTGLTGILLMPDAGHTGSVLADPAAYYNEVFSFLDKVKLEV